MAAITLYKTLFGDVRVEGQEPSEPKHFPPCTHTLEAMTKMGHIGGVEMTTLERTMNFGMREPDRTANASLSRVGDSWHVRILSGKYQVGISAPLELDSSKPMSLVEGIEQLIDYNNQVVPTQARLSQMPRTKGITYEASTDLKIAIEALQAQGVTFKNRLAEPLS